MGKIFVDLKDMKIAAVKHLVFRLLALMDIYT